MTLTKAAVILLITLVSACASPPIGNTPTAPPQPVDTETVAPTPSPSITPTAKPTITPTPMVSVTVAGTITDTLKRLGGYRCPASKFTCVTLQVPRDHFTKSGPISQTMDVVFAVLPAKGKRKGMFVTAVGGPGSSGIAVADSYTDALDPSIPEHFDLVFFDQRGVGLSGGLACSDATAIYYQTDARTDTPERQTNLIAAARTFAETCIHDAGGVEKVRYLDTYQAAEDLEVFRRAIGDGKFWLYGESYGTQLAQTYAASHAGRLAGLVLDGAVDLTISGPQFAQGSTEAFNDILLQTLATCEVNGRCAQDIGGNAIKAYDDLAARLAQAPIAYTFPLPSGKRATRTFKRPDLDTAVSGYLNTPDARMLLQRALAATTHGDFVSLARLLYGSLGMDEETLAAKPDPSYSDAAYYVVTCSDYLFFTGSPEQRAQAYIAAGTAVEARVAHLGSVYFGDLPCVFWPMTNTSDVRPAPLTADGVPTLVLGATADPLTPLANAESVFKHLADGYLITTQGGSHVTFGRGDACPDDIVTAFLVKDKRPPQRETQCVGILAIEYVPIAPPNTKAFANSLDALTSAWNEITNLPEYIYWDGNVPLNTGCTRGGTLLAEHRSYTDELTLKDCVFSEGFVMNGSGVHDLDIDQVKLELTISGLSKGKLVYQRGANGAANVTGTYAGKTVKLTRPGK